MAGSGPLLQMQDQILARSMALPMIDHLSDQFTYSDYQHDLETIPRSSCGDPPPQGPCLLPPIGWIS